jgi:hypothetical protein
MVNPIYADSGILFRFHPYGNRSNAGQPPNAVPKRCSSLTARRMVTKGVMLAYLRRWPLAAVPAADAVSRGGDRAEAVPGRPCGRSGQIGAQVRVTSCMTRLRLSR